MQQKAQLAKEKQALLDSAAQKDAAPKTKVKTIGNIVHDSVSHLLGIGGVWGDGGLGGNYTECSLLMAG